VLRVAWTLADLAGLDAPRRDEIGLAAELRQQSRVAA
jgi:predicted ATPase with chaperone activity